ncbi:MAG: DUF4838 domain-containing protein [Planctomycetia bacterium]|nr:DUF4838 domain-containing protein [Planctomycetia bacterium]
MATIVVSSEPTAESWFAAGELQLHLRKITGADIRVVTDAAPVDGPRLLVGESRATRDLDLRSADFQPQEYLISFRPDTVVLMGRDAATPFKASRIDVIGKAAYAAGHEGRALEFGEGLEAIAVRSHGIRDEAGTFEARVWLDKAGSGTLFRIDGGNPWSYLMVMTEGDTVSFTAHGGGAADSRVVSAPLSLGEWHQVTAIYDAGKGLMKLFVDGVSQGSAPYKAATCGKTGRHLGIGGFVTGAGTVAQRFAGRMDSIRVFSRAHVPSTMSTTRPDTLLLLDCDDGADVPTDAAGFVTPPPPGGYVAQGSCYAVYDFLERHCGVRWYAPGDDGTIIPPAATLTVDGVDVRRRPAMEYRDAPPSLRDLSWGLVARGSYRPEDATLFMRRMRLGGRNFYTMHSFQGYYDRFWKPNPKWPEKFEGRHPEYFAQGYPRSDPPPQLCYSNPALIAQVVADARARFDAGAEMVDLVPMDNGAHCKCSACQSLLDPTESDGYFSGGRSSDLVYSFANKVAAELRTSHPDKFVGVLAYFDYAKFPKKIDAMEPNVLVGPCLHVRNWWCPPMKANDMALYKRWVEKVPGRIHCLILYQCFPGDVAGKTFRFFPGFHAHMLADAMRMFHADGVRGIHLCGVAEYIDGYLTFKMMDFADFDVDRALDEFFTLSYGAAAGPMRQIHDLIEETYSNPANYPPAIRDPANYPNLQTGDKFFHQTKEMAWKWLGTKERIDRITALFAKAKAAQLGDQERRHVEAFESVALAHLLEGRKASPW